MPRPTLYQNPISCVCQSVLMVVKQIGLDVDVKLIDFSKEDHVKEEFTTMNPRHCVPFLVDGDLHLWESHAIIPYLVEKYAKDDTLYPRDLGTRARINALLHFDNTILYNSLRNMGMPLWMQQRKNISEENRKAAHQACEDLETLMGEGPWLLGNTPTIADICCAANVQAMQAYIGDLSSHVKLTKWLKHCHNNLVGYGEIVDAGFKSYSIVIRQMMEA